jgi:tetratricopeptide (TPR) repeat protein
MRGYWSDWAATQRVALMAAERLDDLTGQAHARRNIGCAYLRLGAPQTARVHLRRAAAIFGQIGDDVAVARCCLNIAHTFEQERRFDEALRNAATARDLTRAAGDQAGQASALNAIGWCHLQTGNYAAALSSCRQALAMNRSLVDRRGEAATLDTLGFAHLRLGQHARAITCCAAAADLSRALGDRGAESEALRHLGDAQLAAGHGDTARETWRKALLILDELAHPAADEIRARLRQAALPGVSPALPSRSG